MAINFPTNLDDLANVSTGNTITAAHKNDLNDIVEALEAKVGVDSSAVATSHDYKLTHLPPQAQALDIGAYDLRGLTLTADVTTGTKPLNITSTTMCTNLNADTVDGKHVAGTNGAGEITTNDGTQTLTSKTLTSPDINTGTFNGTIDGNWTAASQTCANLGTVTTCDVNGGSIDGVTIGAAAAPTVTNLGAVATCDINGGSIDGVTIGAAAAPTVTNLGAVATCDINGGSIDGVTIGAAVAPTVTNIDINDGTLDGVQIGGTTATGELIVNDANDAAAGLGSQGTTGQYLTSAGAGANPTWTSGSPAYIKVSDVKAQNSSGGTFTHGDWRTRVINTEDTDTGSHCSISSNQITLAAGTYETLIFAPAHAVNLHQARLYNITDGALTLLGQGVKTAGSDIMSPSVITGRFTIAGAKAFEIQHYCSDDKATNGFGLPCNFGNEVYTIAEFRKVA
jgi:hypothetical protein